MSIELDEVLSARIEARLRGARAMRAPRDQRSVEAWIARRRETADRIIERSESGEGTEVDSEGSLRRLAARNDLVDARFFERLLDVSRAVCRIDLDGVGFATGWIPAAGLLITTHRVLPDERAAARAVMEFGADRPSSPITRLKLAPEGFFATSPSDAMDYTLVAFAAEDRAASASFGVMPLGPEIAPRLAIGEMLNIVQHPSGEHRQLAVRENELTAVTPDFILYRTETAPGCSGAPVLDTLGRVVALHHGGVPRRAGGAVVNRAGEPWEPSMGEREIAWTVNEAVRIDAILKDLRRRRLDGAQEELLAPLFAYEPVDETHIDVRHPEESRGAAPVVVSTDGRGQERRAESEGRTAVMTRAAAPAAAVSCVIPIEIRVELGRARVR